MKRILSLICLSLIILSLLSCGSDLKEAVIDYGTSEIYTKEDLDSAIELIAKEFSNFEGCKLLSISYTSDEFNNPENIAWMNDLSKEGKIYTQCINFVSDFRSPKNGGGALEANTIYTDWQWCLARTEDGEWNLLTYGYG